MSFASLIKFALASTTLFFLVVGGFGSALYLAITQGLFGFLGAAAAVFLVFLVGLWILDKISNIPLEY